MLMPNSSDSHLEEVLDSLSPDDEAKFKDYMEYQGTTNKARMKSENFVNYDGGTEKLFDDVYHAAYKTAKDSNLKDKTDDKSVADSLELVVVNSLKKIQRPFETHLWKNFEAMKESNEFNSDNERLQMLINIANNYLGASQQDVQRLVAGVRSGNSLLWNQSVRTFTDRLKDSLVETYVTKKGEDVTRDKEHLFKAYLIRDLREQHKVSPDNLARELSTNVPYFATIQKAAAVPASRDPLELKAAGLVEYNARQKRDHTRV
jgi:hypothetical protein